MKMITYTNHAESKIDINVLLKNEEKKKERDGADNPGNYDNCGSEEDPILHIKIIRTDLDVFAQVLYCD